jgi:hypothetical protein
MHVKPRMEQWVVIPFLTLKRLKAKVIQVELESVYVTDICHLLTVKKWRMLLLQGRTDVFDRRRFGISMTQDLAEALRSMFTSRLFSLRKVLCPTSGVQRRFVYGSFTTHWSCTNSIFVASRTPFSNQESGPMCYSRFLRVVREDV